MSKFASKFQKVLMSFSYRGKEIFKPFLYRNIGIYNNPSI